MTRQVVVSRRGGPEVLEVRTVPTPSAGPGQVRIRVAAAGVAFADVSMREGLYPDIPPHPFVPGVDVVGAVDAVGPGVDGLHPGQRVAALCGFGGYTESLVLDAWMAVPVPDGVGDAEGVALVLNYLTAYQMLRRQARLEPGERILVHGAAGGAGTALLDLASWMKLKAWGTASAGKHATVARYGAVPIDYRREDFVAVIRRATRDGVDAVFDPIGGDHWGRSMRALRPGGRMVCYGFSAAFEGGRRGLWRAAVAWLRVPRLSPMPFMTANKGVFGYSVQKLRDARRDWYRDDLAAVLRLCADGVVKPIIDRQLPLEDAATAHRLMGAAQVVGKIVLRPDGALTPASRTPP
jgi:NADPH:quinone reductase-like Zn-dependent oxidoreductase